ncbi:TetR/AcrR family transcriptional regulator [Asanoa siamensis]|uniref:TetR family transcriptional regulator n=1 Tax=Asanoa siamensis TaxID=926357 RepID=A0ABQ4CMA4_9ACTN|nr:TetR/AcrR family transcriptional regulator [Asanoa siamensis]GIF72422.1 TetR family transcriptional regulator [Asanoa siamensis]
MADRDEVRERVLASARRLFYGNGINVTGVDRLSEDAGVSKRTLYQRFRTKDELITAYLRQQTESLDADLMPAADSPEPPVARIRAVFTNVRKLSHSDEFQGCPVLNTTAEIHDPAHSARAVALTYKQSVQDYFAAQARLAGATDPDLLAVQLTMLLDGAMSYAAVRGGPIPESVEATVGTLLDAQLPAPDQAS